MGTAAIGIFSLTRAPTWEEDAVSEMIRVDESNTPSHDFSESSGNYNSLRSEKPTRKFFMLVRRTSGFDFWRKRVIF